MGLDYTSPAMRKEWRDTAVSFLAAIVALVIWAVATPIEVRFVAVPVSIDDTKPFGIEHWRGLLVVFLVTSLSASVMWTIATERRIPRPRWPFRRRSEPFDPSFIGGILASGITIFFWPPGSRGLLVVGDQMGAYVWAPPNDAGFGISYLTLAFAGIGIARILLTLRVRRRPPSASTFALPTEASPS